MLSTYCHPLELEILGGEPVSDAVARILHESLRLSRRRWRQFATQPIMRSLVTSEPLPTPLGRLQGHGKSLEEMGLLRPSATKRALPRLPMRCWRAINHEFVPYGALPAAVLYGVDQAGCDHVAD